MQTILAYFILILSIGFIVKLLFKPKKNCNNGCDCLTKKS